MDEDAARLDVELSQIPAVSGALVSINAKNGEVVAMMGGYDFATSKYNTATQAYRQTGSAFKPFVYTAAVEWGMGADAVVSGAPIKRGPWQPHNYDGSTSHGDVPMRIALAKSLNIAAVHLLDMVGIQTGSQMVRRFGITVPMAPYLPSALGATEVPLDQMVSAYSAFPGKGVRHEKHLIRRVLDRDGNSLEEWEKTTFKVTSEYVALTMVDMMRGVTSGGGTAPAASSVGVPVAGKTGTVNDHTDVWFIGYTPTYVTGVWMGYPERKQSLGQRLHGRARRAPDLDRLHERLPEGQAEGAVREAAQDARRHPRAVPPAPARDGRRALAPVRLDARRPQRRREPRAARHRHRAEARTAHAPARARRGADRHDHRRPRRRGAARGPSSRRAPAATTTRPRPPPPNRAHATPTRPRRKARRVGRRPVTRKGEKAEGEKAKRD